jgi:hypothetical protein
VTPKEDLINWVSDNLDEVLMDDLSKIVDTYIKENGWDQVEIDLMLDEMVQIIKEGILNVVEAYEEY